MGLFGLFTSRTPGTIEYKGCTIAYEERFKAYEVFDEKGRVLDYIYNTIEEAKEGVDHYLEYGRD